MCHLHCPSDWKITDWRPDWPISAIDWVSPSAGPPLKGIGQIFLLVKIRSWASSLDVSSSLETKRRQQQIEIIVWRAVTLFLLQTGHFHCILQHWAPCTTFQYSTLLPKQLRHAEFRSGGWFVLLRHWCRWTSSEPARSSLWPQRCFPAPCGTRNQTTWLVL